MKSNKILDSAKLNYYRWFNSKIENVEKEYKSNVAIVTNYVKQRFDRLTYLINTYDFAARQLKINFSFLFILILFLLYLLILVDYNKIIRFKIFIDLLYYYYHIYF